MESQESRQQYLLRFMRGCAEAANSGQLGVEIGDLMLNGNLMREAADEFEKLLPNEGKPFKDATDEMRYNIVRAEQHARQAHSLLYEQNDLKRGFYFRTLLGRAQSILMSLWKEELSRRNGEQRSAEHGGDLQSETPA